MSSPEPTTFAQAWLEAERVKAEAEAAHRRALEEAAKEEWSAHIYDPEPYTGATPDPREYDGTGIGVLYGLRGSDWAKSELGDWRVIPGANRP